MEGELSRNFKVFGLCKEDNEEICRRVAEVFESLGEKPRVEASRLGKKSDSAIQQVKVRFPVLQILRRSGNLCKIEKFKSIYLAPNRTPEERIQHKELVLEPKRGHP